MSLQPFRDIHLALRHLLRSPSSSTALLLIAIGVGTTTAVATLTDRALLQPLPYPQGERLCYVWESHPQRSIEQMWVSPPNVTDWQAHAESFEHLTYFQPVADVTLVHAAGPEHLQGSLVSKEFFAVFGTPATAGRTFDLTDPELNRRTVVASHGMCRRRFGGARECLGQKLLLNDKPYEVIGVMPPSFDFPADTELWLPLHLEVSQWPRGARFLEVVGRLQAEINLEQARAQTAALAQELAVRYPETNDGWKIRLVPLRQQLTGNIHPYLLMLLSAVSLLLLITCTNAAHVLLAQLVARRDELAVRLALGATHWTVARQLVTEGLLLTALGAGLGLTLALFATPLLLSLAPVDLLEYAPRLDLRYVVAGLLVALATFIAVMVPPLVRASRSPRGSHLLPGREPISGRSGVHWRRALVATNVALSLALVLTAGVLIRSFQTLRSVEPGFRAEGVLTAELTLPHASYPEVHDVSSAWDRLLERLSQLPGVTKVGTTSALPLTDTTGGTRIAPEDRRRLPDGEPGEARFVSTAPGYFSSLGIPLVDGRTFTDSDQNGSTKPLVVILSTSLAEKYWPNESPIGRRIYLGLTPDQPYEIIGVVGDVRDAKLDTPPRPTVYLHAAQRPQRSMWLALRIKGEPLVAVPALRAAVQRFDANLPVFNVRTLEQWVAVSLRRERFLMTLVSLFAVVTLVLAVLGIYGMFAYGVALRSHEIGIRLALGATRRNIVAQMMREGTALVTLGLATGLGLTVLLARPLSSLLFGVSFFHPIHFLTPILLLSVVALLAVYLPARRASRLEPRTELQGA